MLDRAPSVQALRPRPSRANACARSSRATAPPVGPLPTGPTAAIQTETGELVALALPHRANGRSWRIARSVNPHVLRQVSEADIGRQVVLTRRTRRVRPLPSRISSSRRVRGGRLPALFSVDLCAFGALVDLFLELPWAALRNPVPVPKTCPQTVRSLANDSWVRWCDG